MGVISGSKICPIKGLKCEQCSRSETVVSSLQGGKGVHKIPMFTDSERVEKVNNDLIIPISFLHTFQFSIQFI
jgi:hypothetical protein